MMEVAKAALEIHDLLEIGEVLVSGQKPTLRLSVLEGTVAALVAEMERLNIIPDLSLSARIRGLEHFFSVHEAAAQLLPLSLTHWESWLRGITYYFSTSSLPNDGNKFHSSESPLETLRQRLTATFWELFSRHWWGSAAAMSSVVTTVLRTTQDSLAGLSNADEKDFDGETGSGTTMTVDAVERLIASPLQCISRCCSATTHLFRSYSSIGAVERQWLQEDVLNALGERGELAVESLVRHSFRRDLSVPSASLEQLITDYEEAEVDPEKRKEGVAIGKATLSSPWYSASAALAVHLGRREEGRASEVKNGVVEVDETTIGLLEGLLRLLKKMPGNAVGLSALGLLTQRIVEWRLGKQNQPTTIEPLNTSQCQFYLHLLNNWFSGYVARRHRWSVMNPFTAEDDADLWAFVLERHTFCLRWSLVSSPTSSSTTKASVPPTSSSGDEFRRRLDPLRCILFSVVHCTQIFVASLQHHTRPEKQLKRFRKMKELAGQWMEKVCVEGFARAFLSDMYDYFDDIAVADETSADRETLLPTPSSLMQQHASLLVEGELKLLLYDSLRLVGSAANPVKRLMDYISDAMDFCEACSEEIHSASTAEDGNVVEETRQHSAHHPKGEKKELSIVEKTDVNTMDVVPLLALLLRICNRLRCTLSPSSFLPASPTAVESTWMQLLDMMPRFSKLMSHLKDSGSDTMSVGCFFFDEWQQLLTIQRRETHAVSDEGVEDLTKFLFLAYSTAHEPKSGQLRRSCSLPDLCWDRRKVLRAMDQQIEKPGLDAPPLKRPRAS